MPPVDALPLPMHRKADPADDRWMWPAAWAVVAVLFVVRLTFAVTHELDDGGLRVGARVFEEVTGALCGVPAVVAFVWLLRRWPLTGPNWQRHVLQIGAGFVPISLSHTAVLVAFRALTGPWFGFAEYVWSVPLTRYAYEGMTDLVHTVAIVGCFTAVSALRERDRRSRHTAELERALLDAELRTLRLRLEPHFLFNALNTISGTMYTDVAAADAQLSHLADLLRAALRTSDVLEVPLADELAHLAHYVAIAQARFEERMTVCVCAPREVQGCRVPSLLLQPLVENAVRHGGLERTGRVAIEVSVRRDDQWLHLRVHDDGPGLAPGRDPFDSGTGLSTTVHRLRLMYGDAASLTIDGAAPGFAVDVRLPATEAAPRVASHT